MSWRVESIQKSRAPGLAMVSLRNLDDREDRIATRFDEDDLKRKDVRIGDTVLLQSGGPFSDGRVTVLLVELEERTGEETTPYYMEEKA